VLIQKSIHFKVNYVLFLVFLLIHKERLQKFSKVERVSVKVKGIYY